MPMVTSAAAIDSQANLVSADRSIISAILPSHQGLTIARHDSQIKSLGLEHRVKLVGFRPDILSLLKGVDLFVMSSITEGLGTSILDAMAASKAVVGTTAGRLFQEIVQSDQGGAPHLLRTLIERSVFLDPAVARLVPFAPDRLEHPFRALDLLHG